MIVNRPFDVYVLGSTLPNGSLTMSISDGGMIANGVVLAVQKFLLMLLTQTPTNEPARGTDFLTQLYAGTLRTSIDVAVAFNVAAHKVITYLEVADVAAPDDEKIASVVLNYVYVQPGEVTISATLTTAAGANTVFSLPVKLSLI